MHLAPTWLGPIIIVEVAPVHAPPKRAVLWCLVASLKIPVDGSNTREVQIIRHRYAVSNSIYGSEDIKWKKCRNLYEAQFFFGLSTGVMSHAFLRRTQLDNPTTPTRVSSETTAWIKPPPKQKLDAKTWKMTSERVDGLRPQVAAWHDTQTPRVKWDISRPKRRVGCSWPFWWNACVSYYPTDHTYGTSTRRHMA